MTSLLGWFVILVGFGTLALGVYVFFTSLKIVRNGAIAEGTVTSVDSETRTTRDSKERIYVSHLRGILVFDYTGHILADMAYSPGNSVKAIEVRTYTNQARSGRCSGVGMRKS